MSIVLHLCIGGILIFSFKLSPSTPPPAPKINIVKAVSVDKTQVEKELKRLEDNDKAKIEAEIQRQKELEKKTAEIEKKRIAEEKKLADIKKKQEQEQIKRKEEELKLKKLEKEKKELEQKRKLEQEKKQNAEAEKKKEEERKKKEAELKKLEEEKKKKAEEEKKRKEQEKALQEQLDAELQAEQEQQDLTEIQKYTALISRAVENSFNKLVLPEGLSCVILIRLLEGGKVADVSIAKSSGNDLFDKRAEDAVYKASPLPVPTEERIFKKMRTIEFTFKPKSQL